MINKLSNGAFKGIMLVLALFSMGTIRKDQDPILKTQTDPIALKQKLEETKDGVKGAPSPSFQYYTKEDFLARTPMKAGQEAVEKAPAAQSKQLEGVTEVEKPAEGNITTPEEPDLAMAEKPIEDKAQAPSKEEGEEDWWLEDQAQDSPPK